MGRIAVSLFAAVLATSSAGLCLPSPDGDRGARSAVADLPAPLTLEDAVDLAQRNGLDARAARGARDAARWEERAFDARLWPQVRLSGTVPSLNQSISQVVQPDGTISFIRQRQRYSSLGISVTQPVPHAGGQLVVSSGLSRLDLLGSAETRQWQSEPLAVGWTQELLRPRSLLWDKREQRERTSVAERQYREAVEDVAAQATAAYFDLYAAGLAERNAVANAAVNDTLFLLSHGRYEVGRIGENDLLQSELALLRARASVEAARLEHGRALAALRLAINVPDGTPLEIASPPSPLAATVDSTTAVEQALRNQSRAKAQDLAALSARRRLAEARLAGGPSATLNATIGLDQTADDFHGAYRDPLDHQQLSLAVDVPIWEWGGARAAVRAAAANRARQESESERARREIAQEAGYAARQFVLARSRLDLAAKADTVAGRRFDVAKNRYVVGKIGIADLYLAQSEKDAALESYVQAIRGYWLAYYQLRRVTLYDFVRGRPITE